VTRRQAGRVAFAVVVLLSLVVLFEPGSDVPSGVPINDKVVHFTLFAALAVTGRLAGIRTVPLVLGLVAYAGISEVLQSSLPIDRDGDVRDALADTLGVLVGVGAMELWRRKRRVGA
jgi:VanZ family protein